MVQSKAIYLPKNRRKRKIGELMRCDNLNCPERAGGSSAGSRGVVCEPPTFFWRGYVKGSTGDKLHLDFVLCCNCHKLVDEYGNFELVIV